MLSGCAGSNADFFAFSFPGWTGLLALHARSQLPGHAFVRAALEAPKRARNTAFMQDAGKCVVMMHLRLADIPSRMSVKRVVAGEPTEVF
jgi:hypothetical protein